MNRLIIVKLVQAMDKSKIVSKVKNLKKSNELRKSNHKQPIYGTVSQKHLHDKKGSHATLQKGKRKQSNNLLEGKKWRICSI